MTADDLFVELNFDPALRNAFARIAEIIEDPAKCGAKLYRPPHMKEIRAAEVAAQESGSTKSKNVFLRIHRRASSIEIWAKPAKTRVKLQIDSSFKDWDRLENFILQVCRARKDPNAPPAEWDRGDGTALPGGLPETKRRKF